MSSSISFSVTYKVSDEDSSLYSDLRWFLSETTSYWSPAHLAYNELMNSMDPKEGDITFYYKTLKKYETREAGLVKLPPTVRNWLDVCALVGASSYGNLGAIEKILTRSPALIDCGSVSSHNPLQDAALHGQHLAVRLLLKKGANPNLAFKRRGENSLTPLGMALSKLEARPCNVISYVKVIQELLWKEAIEGSLEGSRVVPFSPKWKGTIEKIKRLNRLYQDACDQQIADMMTHHVKVIGGLVRECAAISPSEFIDFCEEEGEIDTQAPEDAVTIQRKICLAECTGATGLDGQLELPCAYLIPEKAALSSQPPQQEESELAQAVRLSLQDLEQDEKTLDLGPVAPPAISSQTFPHPALRPPVPKPLAIQAPLPSQSEEPAQPSTPYAPFVKPPVTQV